MVSATCCPHASLNGSSGSGWDALDPPTEFYEAVRCRGFRRPSRKPEILGGSSNAARESPKVGLPRTATQSLTKEISRRQDIERRPP